MCRLRNVLTSRKWWVAATVVLLGLAGMYLLWRAEEARNGTVSIDCLDDDSFAVEIRTDRPPTKWEIISGSDLSPKWYTWGAPSPEMLNLRCAWFGEVDRHAVEIRLPPGRYILGAHRKSPCGHYGGDTYKTFEVEEGGRVAVTLPH